MRGYAPKVSIPLDGKVPLGDPPHTPYVGRCKISFCNGFLAYFFTGRMAPEWQP